MNIELIKEKLDTLGILYEENAVLSQFTTFRIGGPAPFVIFCNECAQLQHVVSFFSQHDIPFFIIGEGSNLLISDQGLPCPVIKFFTKKPRISCVSNRIVAEASACFDSVVLFAAENGLKGINYASGIPGTVGGALSGNAGAFGSQIGDVVKQAEILSVFGDKRMMSRHELQFSYRDSALKYSKDIVLNVYFSLQPFDRKTLLEEREDLLLLRKEKHPDYHQLPCAGSFFKNIIHPDGTRQAAGWFLDRAGCKGLSCGGAAVFEKHANIIVNQGGATAKDVYTLARQMNTRVKEKFGFELEPEVRLIGTFD